MPKYFVNWWKKTLVENEWILVYNNVLHLILDLLIRACNIAKIRFLKFVYKNKIKSYINKIISIHDINSAPSTSTTEVTLSWLLLCMYLPEHGFLIFNWFTASYIEAWPLLLLTAKQKFTDRFFMGSLKNIVNFLID